MPGYARSQVIVENVVGVYGSTVKLRRESRFSKRPLGGERPVGGRRDCASRVVAESRLGSSARRCAKRVIARVVQRGLGDLKIGS
jgi:hypothetical protein